MHIYLILIVKGRAILMRYVEVFVGINVYCLKEVSF